MSAQITREVLVEMVSKYIGFYDNILENNHISPEVPAHNFEGSQMSPFICTRCGWIDLNLISNDAREAFVALVKARIDKLNALCVTVANMSDKELKALVQRLHALSPQTLTI